MKYRFNIFSKKDSRDPKQPLIFVGLLGLLFLLALSVLGPHIFSPVVHKVATPVWNLASALGVSLPSDPDSLQDENSKLRAEVERLRAENVSYQVIKDENDELKKLLNIIPVSGDGEKVSRVRILNRPNSSPYDTIVIAAGDNVGVGVGDIVSVGMVAIGEVVDVYGDTSLVELFSTSGVEFNVLLDGSIQAKAVGIGGGNFTITIPRGIEVEEGMVVAHPEIQPSILGIVDAIDKQPSDSFQTVYFRSPVNVHAIDYVEL